jgi:hypothetical protein
LPNRFDDGMSDLIDFPRGFGEGVGRHLVSSPVPQEIREELGIGHFEVRLHIRILGQQAHMKCMTTGTAAIDRKSAHPSSVSTIGRQ